MKLLTLGNPKIVKGIARGYLPAVLHLAPWTLAGVNVCPMAELAGCIAGCLNTAGRGGIAAGGMVTQASVADGTRTNKIQQCRIRRTRQFHHDRDAFMSVLADDIRRLERKAASAGLVPCVRLNGTSDIRWEDIPFGDHASIFAAFAHVQFYDYTKIPNRRRALTVPNYHLTFSYSHRPEFAGVVAAARLNYGARVNMAAVFLRAPVPMFGAPVINGDETDLRFLDKPGCVVALKAKGNAKRDASGFVIR